MHGEDENMTDWHPGDDERRTTEVVKTWERHISTIARAIVIALLAWMGSSTIEMGKDIATIKSKMEAALPMQAVISALQRGLIETQSNYQSISMRVEKMEHRQDEEDARERLEHSR